MDPVWIKKLRREGRSTEPQWRFSLPDAAATEALAMRLAAVLKAGDCLAFEGDLGAGKTTFTAALARGMGLRDEVSSPTFTLVSEHRRRADGGRAALPLIHMDVYRLPDSAAFYEAGLDEYFYEEAVCVVEWAIRIHDALPRGFWLLRLRRDHAPNGLGLADAAGAHDGTDVSAEEATMSADSLVAEPARCLELYLPPERAATLDL